MESLWFLEEGHFLANQSCSYSRLLRTVSWCTVFRWVFEALKSVGYSFLMLGLYSYCLFFLLTVRVHYLCCTTNSRGWRREKFNCLATTAWLAFLKLFRRNSIYALTSSPPSHSAFFNRMGAWFQSLSQSKTTRFLSLSLCLIFSLQICFFRCCRREVANKGLQH